MVDQADMKQTFANLATAAQSGQFMINHDIVSKLTAACHSYIQDLRDIGEGARTMVHIASFGSLNSATALGKKFDDLANNTTSGSGSFVDVLKQHTDTVQQMSDMFAKAGQAFDNADSETQAKIRAVTRNVG